MGSSPPCSRFPRCYQSAQRVILPSALSQCILEIPPQSAAISRQGSSRQRSAARRCGRKPRCRTASSVTLTVVWLTSSLQTSLLSCSHAPFTFLCANSAGLVFNTDHQLLLTQRCHRSSTTVTASPQSDSPFSAARTKPRSSLAGLFRHSIRRAPVSSMLRASRERDKVTRETFACHNLLSVPKLQTAMLNYFRPFMLSCVSLPNSSIED